MTMSRVSLALAVAGTVALSACQTTDPYTGEQEASKTAIGAGIGALAGAAIGDYMDREEAELRRRLRAAGVSVHRRGDNIVLVMQSDVTFPVDGDQVNPQFYQTLSAVGEVLAEFDRTTIEVSGHTDSTGANDYNQDLSERRANSVARILAEEGVMPQRMYVIGLGETRPVASNKSASGRAQNRRVEIQIIPLTS